MVCKKCGMKLFEEISICPYCGEDNKDKIDFQKFLKSLNDLKISTTQADDVNKLFFEEIEEIERLCFEDDSNINIKTTSNIYKNLDESQIEEKRIYIEGLLNDLKNITVETVYDIDTKNDVNNQEKKSSKFNRFKFIPIFRVVCILVLIFSGYKICRNLIDKNNTKKEIEDIQEIATIDKEVINNTEEYTDTDIPTISQDDDKKNIYNDYTNMNVIDVDLNKLKSINNETKGWIQVNGTKINYPFVQHNDNDYYLNYSFYKNKNAAGWVFMDFRNNEQLSKNKNSIIYAHGLSNGLMFGSLKNTVKESWYKNKDNYNIKISQENENTVWEVFSVYHIPTTNDYIKTYFEKDEDFLNFLQIIKLRSLYDFNVDLNAQDKILTLSSCYNKKEKIVLHAKLVMKTAK